MRNFQGFTDDDEEYIGSVISELDAGGIPKKISKRIYAKLEKTQELLVNPLKLLTLLKQELPEAFLQPSQVEQRQGRGNVNEIILSEYFNAAD